MDEMLAPILWEWLNFAVRWLHVLAGIAWIGASFFFIALDLGLVHRKHLPVGVKGEEWQVHGGGFYHMQKYTVAPDTLPEHLTWHKWESYTTWLSGVAMLAVLYWANTQLYLIDPQKIELSPIWACVISGASIAIGWVIYNTLCKMLVKKDPALLMALLFFVIFMMSWGYDQVFTGRAALLHLGAFTATIMTANVFFIIIPNQRIVVADMKAGREPDPKYGVIAKQRSMHNNYLTLPVIFLMLSNHYPLATSTPYNWVIAALVFLMGVTIRHYFNTIHARKAAPNWTWGATAAIFALIVWLSTLPPAVAETDREAMAAVSTLPDAAVAAAAVEAAAIHCALCHAREPLWEGMVHPPKGVVLETEVDLQAHAREVLVQAGLSHAMPPGNLTYMSAAERLTLVRWYASLDR